jgi:hypothetical protein
LFYREEEEEEAAAAALTDSDFPAFSRSTHRHMTAVASW